MKIDKENMEDIKQNNEKRITICFGFDASSKEHVEGESSGQPY